MGLVAEQAAHLVVGLQDDAVAVHDDHGVGRRLDERAEVGGVAALVLEVARPLEPVPGVGGQELEGGDLLRPDRPPEPGPAHQGAGELPVHPHRGGHHRAVSVGAQLGDDVGAVEVVVYDHRPAIAPHVGGHAELRRVHTLRVGVGQAPGFGDAVVVVVDEQADVGRLEAQVDHGVDGPRQDAVLVEGAELASEAGDPAPQGGPLLELRRGPLAKEQLTGELHRDEVGGAGGGQDHPHPQHEGGRADVPAHGGQGRRIEAHHGGGQRHPAPAGIGDVRHEDALQQEHEVEVRVATPAQADARRHQGDVEQRPQRQGAQSARSRAASALHGSRAMGTVPARATPMSVKYGTTDSG